MSTNTDTFWEAVEKLESNSGPIAALFFIVLFAALYLGIAFLAAWAVSITFGTPYWMTLLSIVLLKFALK